MKTENEPDWRNKATLTVDQVAPLLGIGRSSAYDAAASGQIPTVRVGRRILVPVAGLRRLLGEYPVKESSPAAATAGSMTTARGTSHDQDYKHR